MDYQAIYDDLDNLIRNIYNAIDEIEDKDYMKDYIDDLNYIKYDLENNKEERMQDTKNLNEDSIMKVNAKIILRK